jgi:hypothetical protein
MPSLAATSGYISCSQLTRVAFVSIATSMAMMEARGGSVFATSTSPQCAIERACHHIEEA